MEKINYIYSDILKYMTAEMLSISFNFLAAFNDTSNLRAVQPKVGGFFYAYNTRSLIGSNRGLQTHYVVEKVTGFLRNLAMMKLIPNSFDNFVLGGDKASPNHCYPDHRENCCA
jgi:hypothetical protein